MSANTQRTAYNIDQYLARPARHEHCPSQSSRCRVQLGVIDEAALFIATAVRAVPNSPFSFYDRRSSTVKTRECLERSTSSAGPRAIGLRMLDGEQCQRGRVWVSRTQGWTGSPPAPKPETEQPAAYLTASPVAGLARGMAVIRIDDLANGRIEEKVSTPRRTPDHPAARLPGPIHLPANNSGCSTASHSGAAARPSFET
jgi:hypothetical protein